MSRLFKSLLFVAGLAATGTATAQSAPTTEGLNPGDQVRILVWRNTELSGDFTVAANGTLMHPLYRELQVTGVPMATVEDRIRTLLTRYVTTPQFVISPLVRILVSGEVRSPSVYSVPPETTVAQAIVLAGGPTPTAQLDHVRLLRDRQEITVDLHRADSQAASLQIRSGDQILIPTRRNILRDYVMPVTTTVGAVAAITSIFWRR
jgi:polysaccharide export outer membrane protein